jgi:hypothetical protein
MHFAVIPKHRAYRSWAFCHKPNHGLRVLRFPQEDLAYTGLYDATAMGRENLRRSCRSRGGLKEAAQPGAFPIFSCGSFPDPNYRDCFILGLSQS